MKTDDFNYTLPAERIAQSPIDPRDHSRLMVMDRSSGSLEDRFFYDLPEFLRSDDILVFNDSRVIPARLFGLQKGSTTKVELLLLRRLAENTWETLARPGKKVKKDTELRIMRLDGQNVMEISAKVLELGEGGIRIIQFSDESMLEELGKMPLPPYIKAPLYQSERYQTVYARIKGSVAAPTAGLHFTPGLLEKLQQKGVTFCFVTLHIGLDTFRPVRVDDPGEHLIHTEHGIVSEETATLLNKARKAGRRIITVGTSTVRLIEAAAQKGEVAPFDGPVKLFILPGYKFKVTDAMITNFHLPRSTLIMMVSAFAGKELIMKAYEQAREKEYRFYSFGDAMLML